MPSAKQLRILTEAEFQRVFNEVRSDITELQLHDRVFSGVVENLTKYPRLSHNFPAFFSTFYAAVRTDLIIWLGRIYDPEGTGHESCTLSRCLVALRDNHRFFTDEAIKVRLTKDYRTANPDHLAFHRPVLKQIDDDLDRIGKKRKRLISLRHKMYAHKDLETVLSGKREEFLSSHDEVRELTRQPYVIGSVNFGGQSTGGPIFPPWGKYRRQNRLSGPEASAAQPCPVSVSDDHRFW